MPLMTKGDYDILDQIGHFKRDEFKDDPYRVDRGIVFKLSGMRVAAGKPCKIHCAFQKDGHSHNSWHYKGRAIDLNFVGMSLAEQVGLAHDHGCRGIGVYPGWNEPGIHIDDRDGRSVYWIESPDKKGTGEYVYFPDVEALLKRLGEMEA